MRNGEPPLWYFILTGIGICFGVTTLVLVLSGAEGSTALGIGAGAAAAGGLFSWVWMGRG